MLIGYKMPGTGAVTGVTGVRETPYDLCMNGVQSLGESMVLRQHYLGELTFSQGASLLTLG